MCEFITKIPHKKFDVDVFLQFFFEEVLNLMHAKNAKLIYSVVCFWLI